MGLVPGEFKTRNNEFTSVFNSRAYRELPSHSLPHQFAVCSSHPFGQSRQEGLTLCLRHLSLSDLPGGGDHWPQRGRWRPAGAPHTRAGATRQRPPTSVQPHLVAVLSIPDCPLHMPLTTFKTDNKARDLQWRNRHMDVEVQETL